MAKSHEKATWRGCSLYNSRAPSAEPPSTVNHVIESPWCPGPPEPQLSVNSMWNRRSTWPWPVSFQNHEQSDCYIEIDNWTKVCYVILQRPRWEGLHSYSSTYITDFIFDLPDMQQHGRVMDWGIASGFGLVVFQLIKYLQEMKKQNETMLCISIYSVI